MEKTEMKKTLIALTMIIITLAAGSVNRNDVTNVKAGNPIQDPQLQQAWEQLNSLNETIQLPDGTSITGHDLAQFSLDNNIQINWDENNICNGNSCSVRNHLSDSGTYTYNDRIIYVRLSLKADGQMKQLIETMAHEIYHYTEPFGQGGDTLYEEYLAFNISARIAHTSGFDDTCANPLLSSCLKHWFEKHNLMYGYTNFPVYPTSLANIVDTSDQSCLTDEETNAEQPAMVVATQAPSTANPACTINALGLVDCQH